MKLAADCSISASQVSSSLVYKLKVCEKASSQSSNFPFTVFVYVHLLGQPSGMRVTRKGFLTKTNISF